MKQSFAAFLLSLLLVFSGCKGLDDDTGYYPETQAVFFLCPDSAGNHLIRVLPDGQTAEVGSDWGVPPSSFGDFAGEASTLWLANTSDNTLREMDLESGNSADTWSTGEVTPHFICNGREYLLISDSSSRKIAFLKKRNGDLVVAEVSGKPGVAAYNNGKFYLDIGGTAHIYSEKAMTSYYSFPSGGNITAIHVDGYKNAQINFSDSAGFGNYTFDSNGDVLVAGPYPVSWKKVRFTPYLYQQFGGEFLQNIYQTDSTLTFGTDLHPTLRTGSFEADFFEGTLYLFRNDSLHLSRLDAPGNILLSLPFGWHPVKSFSHISSSN